MEILSCPFVPWELCALGTGLEERRPQKGRAGLVSRGSVPTHLEDHALLWVPPPVQRSLAHPQDKFQATWGLGEQSTHGGGSSKPETGDTHCKCLNVISGKPVALEPDGERQRAST